MEQTRENYENLSPYELSKLANELLAGAKCTIWGGKKSDDEFLQRKFEVRMKTGAYCGKSDRKRG